MTDASPRTTPTVAGRLDALPFTRAHLKVLTGSGLGWALGWLLGLGLLEDRETGGEG